MKRILLISLFSAVVNGFYYKRTLYGDANEGAAMPDYVNAYYGFPTIPTQEPRRRPSFNMNPPQGYFHREHPFDFGPFGYMRARIGEANFGEPMEKTDRERAMERAKPGFWRQNQRETMDRIKKIIGEQRMNMEQKQMHIRRVLANESDEIRSKFADIHKRLIMKNNKMTVSSPVPELSKQAKKLEKEAKKIMENKKMSVEKKQEKLDKLMLKAPENVKNELNAMNDSGSTPAPIQAPFPAPGQTEALNRANPSMASQVEVMTRNAPTQAVVEARQIRVSEDGKTVEI
ncbi:DUF148 domain-containing protein [Caenorhabditis elegans]|uniref:DUF148 domain-containing protein n=2 Tax=Caenorhabditis elegans TaxID=6239 RepID=A0A2C9C2U4_CAEEL|nr:DUF148 domain-containing protein [Caenorhabditis elegans]SOF58791.1 DUF148 domain-containing protein [Caenorhabditis elegans]|eukprot:NP_498199.2 Uncharacterized protein CELE_F56D2.3 [Caenorhabditis elegans]